MTDTLIQRLRDWRGDPDEVMAEAADALEQQAAQIAEKDAEIALWAAEVDALRAEIKSQLHQLRAAKTMMIAAAEEISAHWDAHCDAEGYGPVNLLHRLEQGIPSEYGYTAGAFARMKAEVEALRADADRLRAALTLSLVALTESVDSVRHEVNDRHEWYVGVPTRAAQLAGLDRWLADHEAAITAARAALRQEQPT